MYDQYRNHLHDVQNFVNKHPDHKFIIMGDFNRPHVSWSNEPLNVAYTAYQSPADKDINSRLCSFYSALDSQQKYPAHPDKGYSLDLFFCPADVTTTAELCDPLVPTDFRNHRAAAFSLNLNLGKMVVKDTIQLDYTKADYNAINNKLRTLDWDFMCSSDDINIITNEFYNKLNSTISEHIPTKKAYSNTFPAWYSPELKDNIYKKKAAHVRYKVTNQLADYIEFKKIRALCIRQSRSCYRLYLEHIQSSLYSNLKYFWSYLNKCKKSLSYPKQISYKDRLSADDQEASNLFAAFFGSVYRQPWSGPINLVHSHPSCLPLLQITQDELSKAISEASDNPNYGPDQIPLYFFKRCESVFINKILDLFNISLLTGKFPDVWKTAFVQPIHKQGSNNLVDNYRPISILSSLPKIFDKIIADKLCDSLIGVIAQEQHGFIKGKSTLTNLLIFNEFINQSFSEGFQVDAIYLDFSKAFDSVQHPLLLAKLHNVGIRDTLLQWIGSYLNDRIQIVRLNGTYSDPIKVSSGVPQGSHLGPLLFLIFINDITHTAMFSSMLLFADDLKLYRKITDLADCLKLQADLTALFSWSIQNDLPFNIKKCSFISFTRSSSFVAFEYNLDGTALQRVNLIKDLGVLHDAALKFDDHLDMVNSKAHNTLGFIIRNTKDFRNKETLLYLYKTLVLPHLTYCSQIWSPYTKNRIKILESSQHRFVRYFLYKFGSPMDWFDHNFQPKLEELNLPTIASLHISLSNKVVFKSLNGLFNSSIINDMFVIRNVPYNIRNPLLLEIDSSFNADYLIKTSKTRMSRNWNNLPLQIRTLNCIREFDSRNKSWVLSFQEY